MDILYVDVINVIKSYLSPASAFCFDYAVSNKDIKAMTIKELTDDSCYQDMLIATPKFFNMFWRLYNLTTIFDIVTVNANNVLQYVSDEYYSEHKNMFAKNSANTILRFNNIDPMELMSSMSKSMKKRITKLLYHNFWYEGKHNNNIKKFLYKYFEQVGARDKIMIMDIASGKVMENSTAFGEYIDYIFCVKKYDIYTALSLGIKYGIVRLLDYYVDTYNNEDCDDILVKANVSMFKDKRYLTTKFVRIIDYICEIEIRHTVVLDWLSKYVNLSMILPKLKCSDDIINMLKKNNANEIQSWSYKITMR